MNTDNTAKRTPGIWRLRIEKKATGRYRFIETCNGETIVEILPHNDEIANAAFIVRACNNHDALLEQCKSALSFIQELKSHGVNEWSGESDLKIAIANAEK